MIAPAMRDNVPRAAKQTWLAPGRGRTGVKLPVAGVTCEGAVAAGRDDLHGTVRPTCAGGRSTGGHSPRAAANHRAAAPRVPAAAPHAPQPEQPGLCARARPRHRDPAAGSLTGIHHHRKPARASRPALRITRLAHPATTLHTRQVREPRLCLPTDPDHARYVGDVAPAAK